MLDQSKRLFPRQTCRLPIQYRTAENRDYREALLFNCSRTGMYFEPRAMVMPGESIHIIMSNYSPSTEGPESFQYYQAETAWCRSIPDDANPRYGLGARLLKRSCRSDGVNAEIICHTCDMCGVSFPCQDLRKTEEFLYLCPSCKCSLGAMPEEKSKQSVLRFLTGNVI